LTEAFINRIATAVPPNDVHRPFLGFAQSLLEANERNAILFGRMAERAGIEHRYSYLDPAWEPSSIWPSAHDFYTRGRFPTTAARMRLFERYAPELAAQAIERLQLGEERERITHLIVTCCTGFSAPGLDLEIMARCGLPSTVERTMVGFMGCYAAINGLKLGRHIVRSEPNARVLAINLELCSLHLQESADLDEILSFLIFSDGCAAALVTADPTGFAMDSFRAVLVPETGEMITWAIGDSGFNMFLSGQVPATILEALRTESDSILKGAPISAVDLWAVHPGGRSVLDAVERALDLKPQALRHSREVLRQYGNMSSATVMFVLERMLRDSEPGAVGCAMSFGPGLIAETMLFHVNA
jgi:predicted naringenin-chalcone synthase